RPPDEIESVFGQIKEDGVTNHVSIMVTRNELLGLVDFEIFEGIYAEIGEQLECIRALDIKICHVVRLVEKGAGLPPGTLFISPVRELGAHHRKGIWSYL